MEEQLISFEVAKLTKNEGFTMFKDKFLESSIDTKNNDVQSYSFYRVIEDEITLELNVGTNSSNINGLWESYYDKSFLIQKNYFAPTQSLLQKWLREKYDISIKIDDFTTNSKVRFDYSISEIGSQDDDPKGVFKTYEEALEEGLKEALIIINKF